MAFSLKNLFNNVFYQRRKDGTHVYMSDSSASWDNLSDKLKCGYENPVLLPILQLISHYASKVEFKIKNKKGEYQDNHEILQFLNDPNVYQSKQDFIAEFVWLKYCLGYSYIYPKISDGFKKLDGLGALFNIDVSKVDFPEGFVTDFIASNEEIEDSKKNKFVYDEHGKNLSLEIKDIIPFYDLPNGINGNLLTAPSRLDALKEPLTNISKAFSAKNIVLQTNGKELFTNKSGGNIQSLPITPEEKKEIENKLMNNYGLGLNRSRSVITGADVSWQSLHINLGDLGLDKSVISDAQMIVSAFNVPRELISYDGKGAKYENQIQATIGFVQGVIQDLVDDLCMSISSYFELEESLEASFDHLPIMQNVEVKRTEASKKKAETLKLLIELGISKEDALEEAGLSHLKFKANG